MANFRIAAGVAAAAVLMFSAQLVSDTAAVTAALELRVSNLVSDKAALELRVSRLLAIVATTTEACAHMTPSVPPPETATAGVAVTIPTPLEDKIDKWGTSNCRKWVYDNKQRCDSGNYKAKCAKTCSELKRNGLLVDELPLSAVGGSGGDVAAGGAARSSAVVNEWDTRDCWKWVFDHEHRCDAGNYKANCAKTCSDLVAPQDQAGLVMCARATEVGLETCAEPLLRKSCMKTCFPYLEAVVTTTVLRTEPPAALQCSVGPPTAPAHLAPAGATQRLPMPFAMTRRRALVWEKRVGLLQRVSEVLTLHGIVHWLNQGTALGAYRHGEPIPWDDDIDISVAEGQADKIRSLRGEFTQREVVIRNGAYRCDSEWYAATCAYLAETGQEARDYFIVFSDAEDRRIWVDASVEMPITIDGRKAWSVDGRWNLIDDRFYKAMLFPLAKAMFGPHEFHIAGDTKRYLCATIGANLDVPGKWNAQTKAWDLEDKFTVWSKTYKFAVYDKHATAGKSHPNPRLVLTDGKLGIQDKKVHSLSAELAEHAG